MVALPIPNIKQATLRNIVLNSVERGTIVSTDELFSYKLLKGDCYNHGVVRHAAGWYSRFDARIMQHRHVYHVESFWKLFKKSVASTHIHISSKYMNRYLDEFTFRSNHRENQNAMFDLLIAAV